MRATRNSNKSIPNYSTDPTNDPPTTETPVSFGSLMDDGKTSETPPCTEKVNKQSNDQLSDKEITKKVGDNFVSAVETLETSSETPEMGQNDDFDANSSPLPPPTITVSPVDCDRVSDDACDTDVDMHMSNNSTQTILSSDFINENIENPKKNENVENPKKNENTENTKKNSVSPASVLITSSVPPPFTSATSAVPAAALTESRKTYAQMATGNGKSPQAMKAKNTSSYQTLMSRFETTFKWASFINILEFKHEDVLEYAINEKKRTGKLFPTSKESIVKSKEKCAELLNIIELEDFFESHTKFNMLNEFNRLRNSRISVKNYLDFIINQQHLKDVLVYFKIPKETFQKHTLEQHLDSIKHGFTKMTDELKKMMVTNEQKNEEMEMIKQNLEAAINHVAILNNKICLKSNFIPTHYLEGKDIFKKDKNKLIEHINNHLKVTIGNHTYSPSTVLNKMDKESHLIEIEMNSEYTEYNREKLLNQLLKEANIDPSSFSPINTVHIADETSKAASIVTYGYLEIDAGKSLPLVNRNDYRSKVITKCVHCTACGGRDHTRYDCRTSSCAICKKTSHRAQDCYFKKSRKADNQDTQENSQEKPKNGNVNYSTSRQGKYTEDQIFEVVERRKSRLNKPTSKSPSKVTNPFSVLPNDEDFSMDEEEETVEYENHLTDEEIHIDGDDVTENETNKRPELLSNSNKIATPKGKLKSLKTMKKGTIVSKKLNAIGKISKKQINFHPALSPVQTTFLRNREQSPRSKKTSPSINMVSTPTSTTTSNTFSTPPTTPTSNHISTTNDNPSSNPITISIENPSPISINPTIPVSIDNPDFPSEPENHPGILEPSSFVPRQMNLQSKEPPSNNKVDTNKTTPTTPDGSDIIPTPLEHQS